MDIFFNPNGSSVVPKLFDKSHIIAMLIILSIITLIVTFRNRLRQSPHRKKLQITMALIILIDELLYNLWAIIYHIWSIRYYLPIEVCTVAAFLSAYMLLTNNFKVFEIVYFWGMAGTVQAIITPDTNNHGYNHIYYYIFFISHGMIVISIIYMAIIKQYKLSIKSIFKSFLAINILLVVALIFDLSLKSNYLYLMHKPKAGSILNYFGPWPWYLIVEEIICIIMFFFVYSPYAIMNMRIKKNNSS